MDRKNERIYTNLSQRFLFFALIMNVTRDLYEINNLINSYRFKKRNILHKNPSTIPQSSTFINDIDLNWNELYHLLKVNRHLTADIFKNLSDLFICYSNLQRIDQKYNPKLVSLLGITSSILALLPIVKYLYRLSP